MDKPIAPNVEIYVKVADRKKTESAGWKVGTAEQFLGLTPEESAYIGLKMRLAKRLHQRRIKLALTQQDVADLLSSSQSRVAKMESGDPTVSIDLLVRALFALGTSERSVTASLHI